MITIFLYTGLRRGEVTHLHKDWVRLDEGVMGVIVVPRASQKRKRKDKRVPLNSVTRPIVERVYQNAGESGYLFESPRRERKGKPVTNIQTLWNNILKKAGLYGKPGVTKPRIHDLRHNADSRIMPTHLLISFHFNIFIANSMIQDAA
jgi:integrase